MIEGAEGLDAQGIASELDRGGRVVVFDYCISICVLTFRRTTAPKLVRAGQSVAVVGLPYTLLSAFFGWWGFPWGVIYTPIAIVRNLSGGRDITADVRARL